MGFTLIHGSLIRSMWNESPEYQVNGTVTRRVFETPNGMFYDPETRAQTSNSGTQDLEWCRRVIQEDHFTKAGWPDYAKKEFPFLVDTNIFCKHITNDGIQFPLEIPKKFLP